MLIVASNFPTDLCKNSKIQSLIGKAIEPTVIKRILQSLDIQVIEQTEQEMVVLVPPYRVDVQRQEDVVEEILRIYGYNNQAHTDKFTVNRLFNNLSILLTFYSYLDKIIK